MFQGVKENGMILWEQQRKELIEKHFAGLAP